MLWPFLASRPATVELSTPPLMATAMMFSDMGGSQRRNFSEMRARVHHGVNQRVDLRLGIRSPQRKPDAAARPLQRLADRQQHVRRLGRAARARRSARDRESTQVQRYYQRLALYIIEVQIRRIREAPRPAAVHARIRHTRQDARLQPVTKFGLANRVGLAISRCRLRSRAQRHCPRDVLGTCPPVALVM